MRRAFDIRVHVEEPFEAALDGLDLDDLRRRFAALMDRAADELARTRLDLDDVEAVRWVRCISETSTEDRIEVRWLSDPEKLAADLFRRVRQGAGGHLRFSALELELRQEIPPR